MHQASFFDSEPQQPVLDAEGGLRYLPGVFDPPWCERLFEILLTHAAWTSQQRMMYERLVEVPRRMASYRLDHYALPPLLAETAQRVAQVLDAPFNSVGLNLYRDGHDSVAPHNDKVHDLAPGQPIAVLSLGATRRMTIRAKREPRECWHMPLEAGSLVVMSHASQYHYDHGIPKAPGVLDPRISLAFRVRRF
ncbi:alpha-ketoglutarate-dependent dioxygenase AlkB family protein [Lysobacter capsici]|uniref:alpha-ketoglutarate-dependent dioxygenase AlkB family protein n=1 Tax=Lysobacter capsici TaxID=435897 RepID=UPI00287BA753|nr:alpha-ketoglutarate-dependent dioxygenase AlkB [Lysobacter capsici]WND82960.1 alpha-ketoglutarate-dependent dioxygenase AlkB [Lysobacter capsici]WND88159.1 alpha-ketoglutarate-dependent dioxygenase AlkB [Lysobacter capsici]